MNNCMSHSVLIVVKILKKVGKLVNILLNGYEVGVCKNWEVDSKIKNLKEKKVGAKTVLTKMSQEAHCLSGC